MRQQAEVMRVLYVADGPIKPGQIVDISKWNPENVRAMTEEGRIRLIGDSPEVAELKAKNVAQADRIQELETKLACASKSAPAKKVVAPVKSIVKTGDK
jgi:hypothetical protein